MRAIVPLGRLAIGSSSNGVTTRKAVSPPLADRVRRSPSALRCRHWQSCCPKPDRVLPYAQRFGDARTGPTRQRQQNGACSVRLSPITRPSQRPSARQADLRSLKPGTCHSCRTCPNRWRQPIVHLSVGQASGVCLVQHVAKTDSLGREVFIIYAVGGEQM
jgi:hypothetical protein